MKRRVNTFGTIIVEVKGYIYIYPGSKVPWTLLSGYSEIIFLHICQIGTINDSSPHAVSANRILWVYAGFWWYHGILVVHLQDSVGAFWAIKDRGTSIIGLSVKNYYDWRTIEGLQLVMHNAVYHYQKFGNIFCGRSMLKRVRNVTGMVPWRRLVVCYSCFMCYNAHVCLPFVAMCDNLHRTVISHSLLWNSSCFGVIFSIHDAKSLHRILLVHYNGFCVILGYRSRLVDT